jgi:hypothetical protein
VGIAVAGSFGPVVPALAAARANESRSESEVPNTLELADRAALSVNALTGAVDTANPDYETYQSGHIDHHPPYMNHRWGGPCLQKPVHALPMMRIMSGSKLHADYDQKMMEGMIRNIDGDGIWWLKTKGAPWRAETFKEDQCWPVAQGKLIVALLDWHKYDKNPRWLEVAGQLSKGLNKIAITGGDRAWYHTAYSHSGWHQDESPSAEFTSQVKQQLTPNEPKVEDFYAIGLPMRGLARWYEVSGDKQALDLAERLTRFLLKPSMWGTKEGPTMSVAAEHGLWSGHFHSHTMGMMGLLEYANVTNNTSLQRMVASFYEWSRNFGISRIGFFPAMVNRLDVIQKANEPQGIGQVDEGCAIADMIWLAATLSETGVGDYWDDVDQYVRNHLVEHQLTRSDVLKEIAAVSPRHSIDASMETDDDVLQRNIGSFVSGTDPTMAYAWWTMCCNANCPIAMYKAWSSIVQYDDGVAQVNLLLNRSSSWLDVDSYLPYEGKVVLKNKMARTVYVRVPGWVDKRAVACRVNQRLKSVHWLNQYLIVDGVAPKDSITVEFPVAETVEKYTDLTYGKAYTCRMRGNTLVDVSPRAERPAWTKMGSDDGANFDVIKGYPLYVRDHYLNERKAPMKSVQRYISPAMI